MMHFAPLQSVSPLKMPPSQEQINPPPVKVWLYVLLVLIVGMMKRKEHEPAGPSRPITLCLACRRGRESSEKCDDGELHLGWEMGGGEGFLVCGLWYLRWCAVSGSKLASEYQTFDVAVWYRGIWRKTDGLGEVFQNHGKQVKLSAPFIFQDQALSGVSS